MIKIRNLISLILLIILGFNSSGQMYDKKKGGGFPDPQLSQKDNDYLDRQAKVFLDTVRNILDAFPPAPIKKEARERGLAKLLLDAVFHEHYAAYRKPVQEYFHERINTAIVELEQTKIDKGARIWKIYDMGFIVRTKTVTIAFDLVSGITSDSREFAMDISEIKRLVNNCDVLFISHRHEDHADMLVAKEFLYQNKPVVAPEQVWSQDSIFSEITHLERGANKKQKLKLNNYELDVVIYPGHQMRSIENNVSLVKTPEGITIAHMGDQINEGDFMIDFEWIERVKNDHQVDILMPAAWTMDIYRIVQGFDPELVLPGHELELGHTVWDRLPFWGDNEYLELSYDELKQSSYPVVVLTWGEHFEYKPD